MLITVLVAVLVVCVAAVGGVAFLVVRDVQGPRTLRIALPILAALVPFLCCACLFLAIVNPANDIRLWQFKRNMAQIAHPPDSTLLASRSDVGLLAGNGNHCDYFAGQMRQIRLSRQEVEDFYAGVTIPVARVGDEHVRYGPGAAVAVRVLFVENVEADSSIGSTLLSYLPYRLEKASDWGVDVAQYPDGLLYVVYALDAGYSPGEDIRCH